ncbi:MAG: hypothetical protein AB8G95_01570 [Anaerolineae bacterium]
MNTRETPAEDTPLEKRIKRFYKKQELDPNVLAELKALATPEVEVAVVAPRRNMRPLYAYAFALFIALSLGLFGLQRYSSNQHIESVAAEIALNHAKKFNTEFTATNIANLSEEMHLLDFSVVHPQRMQYENYNIIGARYCTIDSSIAVQIHLEDDADHEYTLYEFREPTSFLANQEKVIDVEGIQVTLWKEGEVVMGLAHRAKQVQE